MKTNKTLIVSLFTAAVLSASISRIHAQGGSWAEKAPMPTPPLLYALGVGVVNGTLYTVGGQQYGGPRVAAVYSYNPATDTWATKASLSIARADCGVGVINGILYAAGGLVEINGGGDATTATVEAYDPTSDTWSAVAPMPDSLAGLRAAAIGGNLYVVGGTQSFTKFSTVWAYDPIGNTWTSKASMPSALSDMGVDVINGILYAVGGYDGSQWHTFNWAYDPTSDSWKENAPMPEALQASSAAAINGILYVTGINGDGTQTVLLAYNPTTDTWTTNAPMPTVRSGFGLGVVNGSMFAIGGYYASGLATNEAFTPNSLAINMYAGLTIYGQVGSTYEIDYCNDLGTPNWMPLTTMVLSNSPSLYIDTNSTYFSHRFYRAVPQ
jgi:N-acetylneuraminic acid mutarotase